MNITKENIEIILYDYAEGNLCESEAKQVQSFLLLHPEYADMLSQYDPTLKLSTEDDICFDKKEQVLLQTVEKHRSKKIRISRYIAYACGVAAAVLLFFALKTLYTAYGTKNTDSLAQDTVAVRQVKNAESRKAAASSESAAEKTPFFDSKNPLFSLKKPPFPDSEAAFGKSEVQKSNGNTQKGNDDNLNEDINPPYEYAENQTLSEDNDASNQPDVENTVSNNNALTSDTDLALRNEETQVPDIDYENMEYRIIFYNNRPTLLKRLKRLIGLA